MYKKSSTGCLEASPDKVVTAIAFQFEMTLGSPAAAAGAAVAVPVPVPRGSIRAAAAAAASHLRVGACRRRVDGEEPWRTKRMSHPQERPVTVIGGGAPTRYPPPPLR